MAIRVCAPVRSEIWVSVVVNGRAASVEGFPTNDHCRGRIITPRKSVTTCLRVGLRHGEYGLCQQTAREELQRFACNSLVGGYFSLHIVVSVFLGGLK